MEKCKNPPKICTVLTKEQIMEMFRKGDEPNFQKFLEENIEWVYPEELQ
jgi:hypothetical protein